MLTRVEVYTKRGDKLDLILEEVSQGFFLEAIDGLDPVAATLVSSSFAQLDGEQYQAARRSKRNLVIKIGIEPDFTTTTAQALRDTLYRFLMPKSEVKLRFLSTDYPTLEILGRIETFDAPKFVKEPSATVSILCFNPDFYVPTPVTFTDITVKDNTEVTHEYAGNIETGFIFKLTPDRPISSFTIYNQVYGTDRQSLDFSSPTPLTVGDVLTISTVSGDKYARVRRGSSDRSVLYSIPPQSSWINLLPGDNNIRVYTEGDSMSYEISYTTKYGAL